MANTRQGRGPHIGFDESQEVEFNQTWVEDAMKDVVAFANTDGGTLYVGVDKHGHIVPGMDVSDACQQ
ncbi:MAG: ATP-binding protein [Candidatus Palauibacterales bacterium]|nr:ATP-binding protein [Candidatus Palauibacterales bacterium]MDP2530579.1 ATP-binding protein [Candidatus Palauibacterales bacterium]MDP2583622.1 ATP-binding protein [Candidatus Palauibacterales bacterium]